MAETQTQPTDRKRARRRRIRRCILAVVLVVGGPPLGYYLCWRWLLTNFRVVSEGLVYRSAQPSASQIRRWSKDYRLRTIINLRGGKGKAFWKANRAAAAEAGVEMVDFSLSAVRLPSREQLLRLIDTLETAERPILIHCAQGADRTGMASVLAAMAVAGQDYDTAREQLSMRYLHVYHGTDRIGGVMDRYEAYCGSQGHGTGGWKQFKAWAIGHYRKPP